MSRCREGQETPTRPPHPIQPNPTHAANKPHPKDPAEQELELGEVPFAQRHLQLLDGAAEQNGLREVLLLLAPPEPALLPVHLGAQPPVLRVGLGALQPRAEGGGAVFVFVLDVEWKVSHIGQLWAGITYLSVQSDYGCPTRPTPWRRAGGSGPPARGRGGWLRPAPGLPGC